MPLILQRLIFSLNGYFIGHEICPSVLFFRNIQVSFIEISRGLSYKYTTN